MYLHKQQMKKLLFAYKDKGGVSLSPLEKVLCPTLSHAGSQEKNSDKQINA